MPLKYKCQICNRELGFEGICYKCQAKKAIDDALALTEEQIKERQRYLVEHLQELYDLQDPAYTYFWECLSYHGIVSKTLQRVAVRSGVFYPFEIYYHAPEDVRNMLLEKLMSAEDTLEASNLLRCLAMQGDDVTLGAFYKLKKEPLECMKGLYVGTDVYAREGGWSFDSAGKRLKVNYDKCYNIEKKNTGDTAVVIGKTRKDTCPHCGGKLVDILSVDADDGRLDFLGAKGKITATCCPSCICFTGMGFGRYSPDGTGEACFPYAGLKDDEENCLAEENYEDLANNGLELGAKEVPLFYGANDWGAVTLGGYAHWIQDCNIIDCPDCGKPMRYLAQLSWESIMNDFCEGTLYVEVCPDCHVVSMQHHQT